MQTTAIPVQTHPQTHHERKINKSTHGHSSTDVADALANRTDHFSLPFSAKQTKKSMEVTLLRKCLVEKSGISQAKRDQLLEFSTRQREHEVCTSKQSLRPFCPTFASQSLTVSIYREQTSNCWMSGVGMATFAPGYGLCSLLIYGRWPPVLSRRASSGNDWLRDSTRSVLIDFAKTSCAPEKGKLWRGQRAIGNLNDKQCDKTGTGQVKKICIQLAQ